MGAVDQATNARLPFGLGRLDLTDTSSIWVLVALILGAVVWAVSRAIGEEIADDVLGFIGRFVPGATPAGSQGPGYLGEL